MPRFNFAEDPEKTPSGSEDKKKRYESLYEGLRQSAAKERGLAPDVEPTVQQPLEETPAAVAVSAEQPIDEPPLSAQTEQLSVEPADAPSLPEIAASEPQPVDLSPVEPENAEPAAEEAFFYQPPPPPDDAAQAPAPPSQSEQEPPKVVPPPLPAKEELFAGEISVFPEELFITEEAIATDKAEETVYADAPVAKDVPPAKRSILPLIGFIVIASVLVSLSAIWFLEPLAGVKQSLQSLFSKDRPAQPPLTNGNQVKQGVPPQKTDTVAAPVRDWNYYLQVSSWRSLGGAQSDANRLRRLGIEAKAESEFIDAKRSTFFRVRVGPYPSVVQVALLRDSLVKAGLIPPQSIVDSVRVDSDGTPSAEKPVVQPTLPGASGKPAKEPAFNPSTEKPKTIDASHGYLIRASSYRVKTNADQMAKKLLEKGLPATTAADGPEDNRWHRVVVGPFKSRQQAEDYLRLVKAAGGEGAYIVEMQSR